MRKLTLLLSALIALAYSSPSSGQTQNVEVTLASLMAANTVTITELYYEGLRIAAPEYPHRSFRRISQTAETVCKTFLSPHATLVSYQAQKVTYQGSPEDQKRFFVAFYDGKIEPISFRRFLDISLNPNSIYYLTRVICSKV